MQAALRAATHIVFENNIETETVQKNIHHSSLRDLPWLTLRSKLDRECVIVGGGPSLKLDIERIKKRQAEGAYVIALNGSAVFLNQNGIIPHALMVLDGRKGKNLQFFEGNPAVSYFLASQCDAELFDALAGMDVTLFHIDTENIGAYVPGERQIQAIGGGASVGLIAMSLAYTLGYRVMHLYGYDSSYTDGAHHSYAQPANDADDVIVATVKGRDFNAAPWMVYQVEQFQLLMPQLLKLDCVVTVHGTGLLPFVAWNMMQPAAPMTETEKYAALWQHPEYRLTSPGERFAGQFVGLVALKEEQHVIEFGCGTGRGGKRIHELTGCRVTQVDLAPNCRDEGIDLPFQVADITRPMQVRGDVGFSTDVMEHLPPENVATAIHNIMACVPECFFNISLLPDGHGALIGHPLHLTIRPADWWESLFVRLGFVVLFTESDGTNAIFHIST